MKTLFSIVVLIFVAVVPAFAQGSVRQVDFNNFTYEITSLSGEDKQKVKVTDGVFSSTDPEDPFYFKITDVAYGDLTGDGIDEAAVGYILNTGGTGNFTNGFVFGMKAGKPVVVAQIDGGDRAYGGIDAIAIENGKLVVDRFAPGPNGGACCPEFVDKSSYKLVGGKLTELGKAVRRELYPSKRVSFEKGQTMSIFRLKLEKYGQQRYIVGARKGQKLLVSSGIEPASALSYNLIGGDGEVENGTNGIIVKLNANGDYIFEISNTTEQTLEFSVTVEIN